MIETFSDEDKLLVRYLFNELEKDKARELEDEMLLDDEWARRAEVVEMNLIDCYVRNELSIAERRRFEEGFLVDPENRDKVDRALMFHESLRLLHEKDQLVPKSSDWSWRRMPSVSFVRPLPVLVLVMAVVLLIGALIVFEIRRRTYGTNSLAINSSSPANLNQNASPTSPSSVEANSSPGPSEVELARTDPDKYIQYEYIHRQAWNEGQRGGLIVNLAVGPGVKTLVLMYELADDKAAQRETYGISIKNQYGERIWPQSKIKEEIEPTFRKGDKRQKLIVVRVPTKVFTDAGPYLLEFDNQYLPAKQFTVKK